jgi:hypothetical protein
MDANPIYQHSALLGVPSLGRRRSLGLAVTPARVANRKIGFLNEASDHEEN